MLAHRAIRAVERFDLALRDKYDGPSDLHLLVLAGRAITILLLSVLCSQLRILVLQMDNFFLRLKQSGLEREDKVNRRSQSGPGVRVGLLAERRSELLQDSEEGASSGD